jgi:hypothetical protein
MIDFIINKGSTIIIIILTIFNILLDLYLSKLINHQTKETRCNNDDFTINKRIKNISTILFVLKKISLIFTLFSLSANDKLRNKIFNFIKKLDNIQIIKYILFVIIFVIYILTIGPLDDIKDKCSNHTISKNSLQMITTFIGIIFMGLLSIMIIIKKFKNNRNVSDDYTDDYYSDDEVFDFN